MIDILLSTYCGEKFLGEQISSIINQSYQDWVLLVRDDGSTDGTLSVLETYRMKYPDKIKILSDTQGNIGVVRSFERLLEASKSEYSMFCDQDDVWLPDKVEMTFREMKNLETEYPNLPLLVHTDLRVVDSELKEMASSFWDFSKLDQNLLSHKFNYLGVCNGVTGCTVMINRRAKKLCLPFPATARMHDAWIALYVCKEGKIGCVEDSTILYRQHSMNVLGAQLVGQDGYLKRKIQNLSAVLQENKRQRDMLKELSYGSCLKYYWFKFIYFFRVRL